MVFTELELQSVHIESISKLMPSSITKKKTDSPIASRKGIENFILMYGLKNVWKCIGLRNVGLSNCYVEWEKMDTRSVDFHFNRMINCE